MGHGDARRDRCRGVLLGAAVGDVLGVPYEFECAPFPGAPELVGGGLGGSAPGEWSDDTAQTWVVARAVHDFGDLDRVEALDAVARGLREWFDSHPPDIGNQTRAVLQAARSGASAQRTAAAARAYAESGAPSAGNGSLMRTAPVALAYLDRLEADLVRAARAVSELTHADPLAGDGSALWCLAVREAVRTGELPDLRALCDHLPESGARARWREYVAQAEAVEPGTFAPNGFVVRALQAAWSAITHTPLADRATFFADVMSRAIGIGNDTDTVASIAGALAGAVVGAEAIPTAWRRAAHGYPGITGEDLAALALPLTATGDEASR